MNHMNKKKECEELWAKNKYYVLSKSHKVYLEIRKYLKEKEIDIVFINERIQKVRDIKESKKDFSNAILHLWGYFKKKATKIEKQGLFNILEEYMGGRNNQKKMRLWHEQIIHLLPKNQLLGQHRECCALRGNGWKKKHKTVDYVFLYSPYYLFVYHSLVMDEMEKRGYKVSKEWRDKNYRGKKAENYNNLEEKIIDSPIYKEHDNEYLVECIENLQKKGIEL